MTNFEQFIIEFEMNPNWGKIDSVIDTKNITRYYGGKNKQIRTILKMIMQMQMISQKSKIVSLFAGGGVIEMSLLNNRDLFGFNNMIVNDGDKAIIDMYKAIKEDAKKLADTIINILRSDDKMRNVYNLSMVERNKDQDKYLRAAYSYIQIQFARDSRICDNAPYRFGGNKAEGEEENANFMAANSERKKIIREVHEKFKLLQDLLVDIETRNERFKDNKEYAIFKDIDFDSLVISDSPYVKGSNGYKLVIDQDKYLKQMVNLSKKGCSIIVFGYPDKNYDTALCDTAGFKRIVTGEYENDAGNPQTEVVWIYIKQ